MFVYVLIFCWWLKMPRPIGLQCATQHLKFTNNYISSTGNQFFCGTTQNQETVARGGTRHVSLGPALWCARCAFIFRTVKFSKTFCTWISVQWVGFLSPYALFGSFVILAFYMYTSNSQLVANLSKHTGARTVRRNKRMSTSWSTFAREHCVLTIRTP